MKRIHLKLDDEMFRKFKIDKARLEKKLGRSLSWEEYSSLIFGFSKNMKGGSDVNSKN